MAWALTTISELANCTLDAWSVFEVPFEGHGRVWTRHFVGFRREGCRGQVSSPVLEFDPASRRGRTRSGRVYELAGGSGINPDAMAVWGLWKAAKALGVERDVTAEVEGLLGPAPSAPRPVQASGIETVVGAALRSMGRHQLYDLRSLALHEAAVAVLRAHPARAERALAILARWEATGDRRTKPLWDEWRRIIRHQEWHLAVEDSDRGQQLRQASPLSFVLDAEVREEILKGFRVQP